MKEMRNIADRGGKHHDPVHGPPGTMVAMLDKYGRFIDDSRDYVISQALELVFKRDKEFAAGSSRTEMLEAVRNAPSPALNLLVQHHSLDHSGMREESALAQKPWARCKQNQRTT